MNVSKRFKNIKKKLNLKKSIFDKCGWPVVVVKHKIVFERVFWYLHSVMS
jgi:hypothetical protein